MSDVENGGNGLKGKFEKMAKSPFFTFSKPYLDFLGKEKIFNFVYIVMAVVNLILPFVIMYMVIDSGLLRYGGAKYVVAFIFAWLVILFACWIGFQLWWNRRTKIANLATSEFFVTAIFSEILQTSGEWVGTLIGIIGAGVGLVATITLGRDANDLFYAIGMRFMGIGAMVIFIGPVIGFFIIIFSRFIAEQLRLFAALTNNTKEIAANIKNKE